MPFFEQGYLIVQKGLDYTQLTVSSSVVGLADADDPIPTRQVRRVVIQVRDAPVLWIAHETKRPDQATKYGLELDAEDYMIYDGDPEDLHFVLDPTATQDAHLKIHYFGA